MLKTYEQIMNFGVKTQLNWKTGKSFQQSVESAMLKVLKVELIKKFNNWFKA